MPAAPIRRMALRLMAGTAGLALAGAPLWPAGGAPVSAAGWVATWAASPQQATSLTMPVTALSGQTVRNIVYTSTGGNRVRIRVSNSFGHRTVVIGAASVGVEFLGARLERGSVHRVTFSGHRSVALPPGAEAISDPVTMRVPPLTDLAVSLFVPGSTGPVTNHSDAQQVNYLAAGNHASDAAATAFGTAVPSWYLLDDVAVAGSPARGAVVAFGDSITDGFQSQVNANDRWPNDLARRLAARFGAAAPAVIDEGISGNRVLHNSVCFGVNALARFGRDVLSQPGARDVIMLEGINDIGFSQTPNSGCTRPNTAVTAQQIIRGYQQIIARAHAAGLKIFGATLTPFRPAGYWSPAAEAKREAVNHWILTSGAFDGVVDFARAIADPGHPQFMNPKYDSGDHLHPNDAGYQAMANAINLALLG
jgi:lysophospholipase L1-like esterase